MALIMRARIARERRERDGFVGVGTVAVLVVRVRVGVRWLKVVVVSVKVGLIMLGVVGRSEVVVVVGVRVG